MPKKLLWVIGIIAVVIILIIVLVPLFINADNYRPEVQAKLKDALGRDVQIGHLGLKIFSGSLSADSISIADDPAFSKQPFVTAKALNVGVDIWPLIFSKKLQVSSIELDTPKVVLLQNAAGKWNFSSLGGANETKTTPTSSGAARPAPEQQASAQNKTPASEQKPTASTGPAESGAGSSSSAENLSIGSLQISNGTLSVGRVGGRQMSYTDVALNAKNISYTSQFPFTLTANTPGGGKISLDGNAGPVAKEDASFTPFDAKATVQNLDLAQTGFVGPDAGIGGILSYNGNVKSDGKMVHSQGTVDTQKLRAVKGATPATVPLDLDYAADYDLAKQTAALTKGDIHVGKSLAKLSGAYDAHTESPTVNMKLVGNNMAVPDIEGLLPAVGVTLPEGTSLQGGTANANLALTGPVNQLVTSGPIDIKDVKWAGFDLASKLGPLAQVAGLKGGTDTTIQTLSSQVRVAPTGIVANNLDLVVAGIGAITGNGTVNPNGAIDAHLVAKITATGGAMGALTQVSAIGGGKGIPIHVTGTTSKPVFTPDMAGLSAKSAAGLVQGLTGIGKNATGQQQNSPTENVGGLVQGIFGKKKK